jgi:hypothetical protein
MESFTSIAIAFITGVLGPVLILIIKNRLDKRSKPDVLADALKTGELVTIKIDNIREDFKADRVWITQFHNGGHFYPTGKSIAKFSVIYETVASDTSSIQNNFQNIPVNLFTKSMNRLLTQGIIEVPDYKDETVATYGLKYIAEESDCKSGYLFAIKTIDDRFIGVLGVDYTKKKHKLSPSEVNQLTVQASSIGGALMKDHR